MKSTSYLLVLIALNIIISIGCASGQSQPQPPTKVERTEQSVYCASFDIKEDGTQVSVCKPKADNLKRTDKILRCSNFDISEDGAKVSVCEGAQNVVYKAFREDCTLDRCKIEIDLDDATLAFFIGHDSAGSPVAAVLEKTYQVEATPMMPINEPKRKVIYFHLEY